MAEGQRAPFDDALNSIIADPAHDAAPGCVAGRFQNGQVISISARGYADLQGKRALNGDTLFYAASISKQFTALTAATLIAQGKLALEDDVRRYLPELPAYRAPVTVSMLMRHTSGVRDSLGLLRMAGMDDVGQASKEEALQLLFRQRETNFTPGSAYSYSNGGYLLLAEIVERVSGKPFADYAREVIFAPLKMRSATFLSDANPKAGTFAHGYIPQGDGFAMRDTFPRFSGSGGLMLSMNDLARYEQDIERGHKVWTPRIADIMLTSGHFSNGQPIDDGAGLGYGGGLHIGEKAGERVVQHTGSAEAFKHAYIRLPEKHVGFALLCNRGDWTASAKLKEIMAASGQPYPGMPLVKPEGLFHSEELNADYRLTPEGEGLRVEITSPLSGANSHGGTVHHFRPEDDGKFHSGIMTITPGADASSVSLKRGEIGEISLVRSGQGGAK